MKQTLECNLCRARVEVERGGRIPTICGIPQDGGGSCRGRMMPVLFGNGGISGRVLTQEEMNDPKNRAEVVVSAERAAATTEPVPFVEAYVRSHGPELAAALESIVGMTRGGTFAGGQAAAVLMFESEDARAVFAAFLDRLGVRISA